jgi:hypothetical protein
LGQTADLLELFPETERNEIADEKRTRINWQFIWI